MAGAEAFEAKLDELAGMVGDGTLRGAVEVDQVYAQYQHEGLDLRHPRGGQAKYLEQPLYAHHRDYVQALADNVLRGSLVAAMEDNMEDLAGEVYDLAPREFHDLRASGHPTVSSGGTIVYDRPPMVARLTVAQLKAKDQLRALGDSMWPVDA